MLDSEVERAYRCTIVTSLPAQLYAPYWLVESCMNLLYTWLCGLPFDMSMQCADVL